MKPFLMALPPRACLATGFAAQAASTVDLRVCGLITPSACEPSVSNGGVYPLGSTTSSGWAPTSLLSNAFLTSFTSVPTGLTPTPIQQLNADLQITPTIAAASTLPLTEQMPIDGSVTLTMKYL
ncbi:hypothetical protein ACMSI6_22360 [Pseudomonas antarctica]|uniref:hypothetical protein n=1 Tax=Pseudomonas antarctica TaxID=219572 RepID=UPI00387AB2B0